MTLLLTGGTGFVGQALCRVLLGRGYDLACAVRSNALDGNLKIPGIRPVMIPTVDASTDWTKGLAGVDTVIHLAGMAHVQTRNPFDLYHRFIRVNYAGTLNLALQAARAGVRRFVFLSSIGVNGVKTFRGHPFTGTDRAAPHNAYALSKLKAEQGLRKLEAQVGMEVVIVRPPLVYGPGVKANFLRLMDLVYMGVPLPFAGVDNRKSFIGLDNLTDALTLCVAHKNAAGQTFTLCDGEDVSTPSLICEIARAMGKKSFFFPLSPALAKSVFCRMGKEWVFNQLWADLCIDNGPIRERLNWAPGVPRRQGIQKIVEWYLTSRL